MPTFDNNHQQWQSWQPDNLLGETVETPLPTMDNTQSEAQLKAELARLRKQAEQQGFAQGQQQGQGRGTKAGLRGGPQRGPGGRVYPGHGAGAPGATVAAAPG